MLIGRNGIVDGNFLTRNIICTIKKKKKTVAKRISFVRNLSQLQTLCGALN